MEKYCCADIIGYLYEYSVFFSIQANIPQQSGQSRPISITLSILLDVPANSARSNRHLEVKKRTNFAGLKPADSH
jgi:hypothetical protein